MIEFTVRATVKHPIGAVWACLTDWEDNSNWILFTRVTNTNTIEGVGAEFVGVTNFGPAKLVDRMRVTSFVAPKGGIASAEVEKVGPVLSGVAGFTLRALDETTTQLEWVENVGVGQRAIPKALSFVLTLFGSLAFRIALGRFARHLASSAQKP